MIIALGLATDNFSVHLFLGVYPSWI